jgi:hypothetical protein
MATRTQYPFSASYYRYKTRIEIEILRRQWETFERVENYNFAVRARMNSGFFDQKFYTFLSSTELMDYRRGQALHIAQFPTVDFGSESEKFVQQSTIYVGVAYEVREAPRGTYYSTSMSDSERIKMQSDTNIYINVSTFNSTHVYKWVFSSDEERLGYERASLRL